MVNELGSVPIPEILWYSCDGMMVIDDHRRILALNPALERLIGRQSSEVAGRQECGVLLACEDAQGCLLSDHADRCPGLRAMRRLESVKSAEYTVQTAAGKRKSLSASYTPIQPRTGGPTWALVVLPWRMARDWSVSSWRARAPCPDTDW